MKRVGKPVFFVLLVLILAFTATAIIGVRTPNADLKKTYIKGVDDVRWGIDIRGGVDVTFSPPEGTNASDADMDAAAAIIKVRMISQNITDYELYTDLSNDRIIVRFPWRSDESDFDPQQAIQELGETALLTFREGVEVDNYGMPTGVTSENIILEGRDVVGAQVMYQQDTQAGASLPVVQLELNEEGRKKFSEGTGRLIGQVISIWMDDTLISYPTVQQQISENIAMITGDFSYEEAKDLADRISAGALPFRLITENYKTISPTLGERARDAMTLALVIAYVVVALFMIFWYRLPGCVAAICLAGQVGIMLAALTGYFAVFPSFTLTLPGIAGMILSIGMGVDSSVIMSERIKEEIKSGKTIDGALETGYKRAFTAIFDGNITVVIVAVILMGAFGPPSSMFARILNPLFFMFGPATTGTIYSFGFTLLIGVIANFVMGIFMSQLMVKSLARQKPLRKVWLFGGDK